MAATNLSPTPVPIRGLSLYQIESGMLELMQLWEDSEEDPGARATIEAEIDRYVAAEVAKVDGIRGYLKHLDVMIEACKEEVREQSERGRLFKAQRDRLQSMVVEIITRTIPKGKIEGRTGSLKVQANGGQQPLTISFPDALPEDCVDYVVPGELMAAICRTQPAVTLIASFTKEGGQALKRIPNNPAIRKALGETCTRCTGNGVVESDEVTLAEDPCSGCHGTGFAHVPGAHLEPRGKHLVVR